jgi:hypothetical protein
LICSSRHVLEQEVYPLKFLLSESLAGRLIIFFICGGTVFALCAFHGYYDGLRTGRVMDEMAEKGRFTGRFWRTTEREDHKIVVTKFNRTLVLYTAAPEGLSAGNLVSFVARQMTQENGREGFWEAVETRFHGTSTWKFVISAAAVLIVLMMLRRDLCVDRGSRSLAFRKEEKPCRMG